MLKERSHIYYAIFMLMNLCSFIHAVDEIVCEISVRENWIINNPRNTENYTIVTCHFQKDVIIAKPEMKLSNARNESVSEFKVIDVSGVEYLPEDISETFPNLETIQVKRTLVKSVTKKNFHELRKLSFLDLEKNLLSFIDDDSFDDLENLYSLNLNDNRISSLPAKIFSKLLKLNTLHLNSNQLTTLDAETFKDNKDLALLFLHKNQFKSLELGLFDSLTKMRQLWVDSNEISSLHPDLFKNCKGLTELILSDNKLTAISNDLLSNLVSLRNVDFSNNPLSVIDLAIFEENKEINSFKFNDIKVERVLNIDIVDKLKSLQRVEFIINSESCIIGKYHEETFDKLKREVKSDCKTE